MEQKEQNLAAEQELTQAELSELLQIRRDKLKALQEAGQDPFVQVREVWEKDLTGYDLDHILFNMNRPQDWQTALRQTK